MVKLRLQRGGTAHHPYYRIVAADARAPRNGRFVEVIGFYDPKNKDEARQFGLKLDRVDHWLSVGAQPTDTTRSLIRKARRAAAAQADAAPADAETAQKDPLF